MVISVLVLSGCTSTVVNNTCPAPVFPKCSTLKDLERPETPESSWKDWVSTVNVMLKLRELQPKEERDEFINCENPKPVRVYKSFNGVLPDLYVKSSRGRTN